MKSCKDFYNDSAEMWAENWYNNDTLLPYLTTLIQYISKEKPRILDLCCGAGYDSMRLKKLGADVVGLDYSEKELEIAKQKNPNIKFYERDMLNSYNDLGEFDGIICVAGIVHLEGKQLKLAFKNMAEVLKTDGYLLLVFREGEKVKHTAIYNGVEYERNFVYHKQEEIIKAMDNKFVITQQLKSNDSWTYIIYKKI